MMNSDLISYLNRGPVTDEENKANLQFLWDSEELIKKALIVLKDAHGTITPEIKDYKINIAIEYLEAAL